MIAYVLGTDRGPIVIPADELQLGPRGEVYLPGRYLAALERRAPRTPDEDRPSGDRPAEAGQSWRDRPPLL